jgi:hypothetical protein
MVIRPAGRRSVKAGDLGHWFGNAKPSCDGRKPQQSGGDPGLARYRTQAPRASILAISCGSSAKPNRSRFDAIRAGFADFGMTTMP